MPPAISSLPCRVWVACASARDWPHAAPVEDAFGRVHETPAGPWSFFESADGRTLLGTRAVWLGVAGPGLHRVRMRGGAELVVRLDSPHQWEDTPPGAAA